MDIVKRAYIQAREELPETATIAELHQEIVMLMVRWINFRVYSKRDWPHEFGKYPLWEIAIDEGIEH